MPPPALDFGKMLARIEGMTPPEAVERQAKELHWLAFPDCGPFAEGLTLGGVAVIVLPAPLDKPDYVMACRQQQQPNGSAIWLMTRAGHVKEDLVTLLLGLIARGPRPARKRLVHPMTGEEITEWQPFGHGLILDVVAVPSDAPKKKQETAGGESGNPG